MFQACHLGICVREGVYRGWYLAGLKTAEQAVFVPELLYLRGVCLVEKRADVNVDTRDSEKERISGGRSDDEKNDDRRDDDEFVVEEKVAEWNDDGFVVEEKVAERNDDEFVAEGNDDGFVVEEKVAELEGESDDELVKENKEDKEERICGWRNDDEKNDEKRNDEEEMRAEL
jgi:hypothetical protein